MHQPVTKESGTGGCNMKKSSKCKSWVERLLVAIDGVEKIGIRAASLTGLAWIIFKILEYHLHN
jgi:hypothetical protein